MNIITAKGTHQEIGFKIGYQLREAICHNIALQRKVLETKGIHPAQLARIIREYTDLSTHSSLQLMAGISQGSSLSFSSILSFNALQDILAPEGCTTFAAIGKATVDGNALLLKNRDSRNNPDFIGPGCYQNKEINIILVLETEGGNIMAGITTAGYTGFMMGINQYGIAAACNFGQLEEIIDVPPSQLNYRFYGSYSRPQMLREGLECRTAEEAVKLTLAKLTHFPMGTPGILFFVDAGNIYVIEGGSVTKQFAVQHITDGATFRSNHFSLLDHLNNKKDISSICRKIRAGELVRENFGKINREKLIEFSTDHKNGPIQNSICRHSQVLNEGSTVSAAIMEIDSKEPQNSRISIALGSPCWAWHHPDGNLTIRMDQDMKPIPQHFLDGSTFKKYMKNEPFEK